ncbi:MAG: hypothetical protein F9K23_15205 [Bacteroidetes bacterium]|nr:MAG: hypothetical protein F9K23_15205 [Bacteroidota bacterium]
MKKSQLKTMFILLLIQLFVVSACSKKEESPEPTVKETPGQGNNGNNNGGNNPPPAADTTKMFTDMGWFIKKLSKDGVEQTGHFLIGASYKFNLPNTYFFSIPGFPSADGTWVFEPTTKKSIKVTNQNGTSTWKVLSISTTKLVVEENQGSSGVWITEFSH